MRAFWLIILLAMSSAALALPGQATATRKQKVSAAPSVDNIERLPSPLEKAIRAGDFNRVGALIDKGADPNKLENWHLGTITVAILYAPGNRLDQVLRVLLKKGARPFHGEPRQTSDLASASGRHVATDVLERFIALGCDPNKVVRRADTIWSPLLMAMLGTDKNPDTTARTAELLLKHSADPNKGRVDGRTPLLLAIEGGYSEAVSMLISHGADINAKFEGYDFQSDYWKVKWTPIFFASKFDGSLDERRFCQIILDLRLAGASVTATDPAGLKPIDIYNDSVSKSVKKPSATADEVIRRLLGTAFVGPFG